MNNNENDIFAFVLMPFSDSFDDIYKLGIKQTAAELGISAERVDEQQFREGILERIYRQIELADIIIADMSGQNPNVFYEVGYAHAKEKLCILLTSKADDIPFDLKHHRHVIYGESISGLRKNLFDELEWARQEIQNIRSSRIKVSQKDAFGHLEKTRFYARANLDIRIDLTNISGYPSSEIEAVYFYSTNGWRLFQDDKECSQTDADVSGFHLRHFLRPPLRRLHKNSWAQLKFEAKKILAYATEGDELKDSYRVTGRSLLRLVTSSGNFDHELQFDVEVNEVPF